MNKNENGDVAAIIKTIDLENKNYTTKKLNNTYKYNKNGRLWCRYNCSYCPLHLCTTMWYLLEIQRIWLLVLDGLSRNLPRFLRRWNYCFVQMFLLRLNLTIEWIQSRHYNLRNLQLVLIFYLCFFISWYYNTMIS